MCCCVQVSDRGVLVMEVGSGLSFPATEYLSRIIHTEALQGKHLFIFAYFTPFLSIGGLHVIGSPRMSPSSSVSSALGGLGLPPCQHHRLLRDQRAQGRAEAVQTGAGAAGLLKVAGESVTVFY